MEKPLWIKFYPKSLSEILNVAGGLVAKLILKDLLEEIKRSSIRDKLCSLQPKLS